MVGSRGGRISWTLGVATVMMRPPRAPPNTGDFIAESHPGDEGGRAPTHCVDSRALGESLRVEPPPRRVGRPRHPESGVNPRNERPPTPERAENADG